MRKSSRFIIAALAPTLALGLVGVGTAATAAPTAVAVAAAAERTGVWSVPTALTGPESTADIIDVRTTTEGDAVAVWYSSTTPTGPQELRVAVRPAASAEWGPAQVLATLPGGRESVSLVTSPDGSAAVAWVHALKGSSVLRTATLAQGATTWSAPVDIATASSIHSIAFTGGPSGKSVVVWRQFVGHKALLSVSERSGPDGAWSEPAVLVGEDASWPQASVAADGTVTVAWAASAVEGMTVYTATKAADATEWGAPVLVSDLHGGGAPLLSQGPDGTAALAWVSVKWEDDGGDIDVVSAVKAPGSSEWGAPHSIQSDSFSQLRAPLVGPEGDVTLVWIDYQETLGLRTADRAAATGDWSEVRTLSSGYVSEEFDAKIGADGTAQVGWVEDDETSGEGPAFHTASRVGGAWTARTRLSVQPSPYSVGAVAVGPDGNATAVWVQGGRLWSSATGLTPQPPQA
ncbi:hypothetical protein ACIQIG_07360 [Streptomyces bacillaris]|uniref:Uncharacterized protein n=1 Tax=Streptomyces cavourensis TaxID=67258 RepID=A0AAD0Q7H5_9ACTN|nr:hypothetical protein [Streptomyces cavourensis]ATY97987.1 hypothetical protein CVT27_22925 [Streptomyces cavourensis]AXI73813.1 hypothetical protein DTW94_23035 [Streptomyces cavourensis]UTR78144.1 hypothetical protein NLU04_06625 [Streptomyces cavourensis]